jgi:prevent-host-death family protein
MSKGRVLLVDDEPNVLSAYSRYLTSGGFEVTKASGGAEALRQIANGRFDLVLTDVAMPQMNGLELLDRLRGQFPDLPVIVMTEVADNRATVRAAESGALQTFVKPIAPELLIKIAARAVRLHRSRAPAWSSFRNHRGERVEAISVSSTDVKNEFGRVLDSVTHGGFVVITKHESPKAVLISLDEFSALSRASAATLDTLSAEFDALFARMQTSDAQGAMKAAFDATPQQLGRAALAASRDRD